ncbi:hypothetical protein AALO_G00138500 [Alosa alosa]|uniref:Uncharacterized protein n=1 Tax=Alosa alosa TaxID=278164 RepID=A0AAV6GHJ0_9TELE|nr:hypothetical protein AALO_G00138500 [Alosa alosa]
MDSSIDRSKKWWRVFFFFLAVSCHNAYIAARSVGGTTFRNKYRGYKSWLEDLAEQLITPLRIRAVPVTPPPSSSTLSASPSPPPSPSSLPSSLSAAPSGRRFLPHSPSPPPSPSPSVGSRGDTPPPQHDCGKVYDKRLQNATSLTPK